MVGQDWYIDLEDRLCWDRTGILTWRTGYGGTGLVYWPQGQMMVGQDWYIELQDR